MMECEFPSEKAMAEFRLPEWAGRAIEVTNQLAFYNRHLAEHGASQPYVDSLFRAIKSKFASNVTVW